MSKKAFLASSNNSALAEKVIDQIGGYESFLAYALDVARYGASGGVAGFIYYTDTIKFYKSSRFEIIRELTNQARDFGTNVVDMVAGFSCLSDIDKSDIEAILFGFDPSDECAETQIKNALAWFALETVCFDYANFVDA